MKTLILTLLILLGLNHAEAQMPERWNELMQLIDKEIQTIKAIDKLSPNLRFRLVELYTEKLDLIKQKENKHFLSADPLEVKNKGQDHFFQTSRRLEREVSKMGHQILKDFPRFINNPDIIYTLALNSRDYGKNDETEGLLLKALRMADPRSTVVYNTRVALGEYYYNENQHQKAISYYTHVLKNLGDEWHTKHLYNAAWCYLKVQDLNTAIDLLVKAHDLGLQARYINMKDQVLESAQAFYVLGDRIQEGIAFYLKNAEDPTPYLIKMAHRTADRGQFESTLSIIEQNTKLAKEKQNWSGLADIHLQELVIYRNFKRYDLHLQTARSLETLKGQHGLTSQQTEDTVQKLTEVVGYLQIRLTKNAKTKLTEYDPELLKSVITYFTLLASFDPANLDKYAFYQGESFFAVQHYRDAGIAYQRSLEASKSKQEVGSEDDQLRRKTLDALLAVIEYGQFKDDEKEKLMIYTFTNYLAFWPVDEKSRLIYKSLFNIYFTKKDNDKALTVLEAYQKHYPDSQNREIQRAMLTQIIDRAIESKDSNQLAMWIQKLQQGYLSFQKDYIEKATLILGQILFENFSALANSGDQAQAIMGYQQVFEDERYPQKIKAQSSLQIGLLSLKLNQQEQGYQWLLKSLALTASEDRAEVRKSMIKAHEILFLKQNYVRSADLAETLIDSYCQESFEQKETLMINRVAYRLLSGDTQKAIGALQAIPRCPLASSDQTFQTALENTLHFFLTHRKYSEFMSFARNYQQSPMINDRLQLIFDQGLIDIYWDSIARMSKKNEQAALKQMRGVASSGRVNPPVKEMKRILEFQAFSDELRSTKFKAYSQLDEYDDEIFQTELEANLHLIAEQTKKADQIIKWGHPDLTLQTSELMNRFLSYFVQDLLKFRPSGVPEEFTQSFVEAMKGLAMEVQKNAQSYQSLAKTQIDKHQLLSSYNYLFTDERPWKERYQWSFDATSLSVTQSRGVAAHD